jgi:hypothetical protein
MTTAYKGFSADWKCYGDFQYEIGKRYKGSGKVVRCGSGGFHACEMPLDTWTYYGPATSKYAVVELAGKTARDKNSDTKIAAAEITIKAEINLQEVIKRAVEWIVAAAKTNLATGAGGHAAATGHRGHAAATGDSGHAAATGDMGHAAATGYRGHAAATGDMGHAAATGYNGHAAATGDMGHAAATGYNGHAAATGYRGHAAATGDSGHAAATGDRGHAAATGYNGHAAATGDSGHAAATGYRGHAAVKGKNAIAAALGIDGAAVAEDGGAIMLAAYDPDDNYRLVAVFASKVGESGIEPGKAYHLGLDGRPVMVSK